MSMHATQSSKSTDLETPNKLNGVEIDTVFDLLDNSRRRAALRVMFEHERLDFGDLVTKVAELEYGLPEEKISSDERHKIYVAMSQTHADRLEDCDVIKRDRDTGTISLGHNDEMIKTLAEFIAKIDGEDTMKHRLKRAVGF